MYAKSRDLNPGTVKRSMKYSEKRKENNAMEDKKYFFRVGDFNIQQFEKEESDILIQYLCIS